MDLYSRPIMRATPQKFAEGKNFREFRGYFTISKSFLESFPLYSTPQCHVNDCKGGTLNLCHPPHTVPLRASELYELQ